MAGQEIRFDDGAVYEKFMGVWSRSAGEVFLDWIAPQPSRSWLDVGCGNGAFTQLLCERVNPSRVMGVDPSGAQLEFARGRPGVSCASFVKGDALALPAEDGSFDGAVMALVIQFVPDPVRGVAEMVRAVRPGGCVAAYTWDLPGGGVPTQLLYDELEALGAALLVPPSADATRLDAMHALWSDAGLVDVETRDIAVERTFAGFDDWWTIATSGPISTAAIAALSAGACAQLKATVRSRLTPGTEGRITCHARAHAVKGRVPA